MAVKLGMLIHDGTKADIGKGNETKKTTQFATPFGGKPEHRLLSRNLFPKAVSSSYLIPDKYIVQHGTYFACLQFFYLYIYFIIMFQTFFSG